MDESFKDDEWFVLSCLIGRGAWWTWIDLAWQKMLDETNAFLKSQGRRTLTRYKASDCNNLVGEFEGWTIEEQIALTKKMLTIFRAHPLNVVSYSVNLKELVTEIPETKPDPKGFCYVLLLYFLILEIGDMILQHFPEEKLTLIHDRCDYDAALLEAFTQMKEDKGFKYRKQFTTIAPMGWEDCIPLQPADFLAYENLKEAEIRNAGKRRRKSLESLLDSNSFGGRAKGINAEILKKLWKEHFDESSREILLTTARIRRIQESDRKSVKGSPRRNKVRARLRKGRKKAEEI
ncbi:MAG: hypothetical protein HY046_14425 [Acidobacteria bacterium]|nr:hypothetical protein [Acidobacteriota bacterium]